MFITTILKNTLSFLPCSESAGQVLDVQHERVSTGDIIIPPTHPSLRILMVGLFCPMHSTGHKLGKSANTHAFSSIRYPAKCTT